MNDIGSRPYRLIDILTISNISSIRVNYCFVVAHYQRRSKLVEENINHNNEGNDLYKIGSVTRK
ncbi:hypothetical protein YTPLAS21_08170 [Candidatus Nitrosocosmicus sp.]|nr:hypothetical protein YTPLAS21_08170 [Candidatus Nitrosocosmicus sp.]